MITINRAGPAVIQADTPALWQLYRECFAGPPWCEPEARLAGFPDQLRRQTSHPGAGGFLARDGSTLVGAIYGRPAPATPPQGTDFDRAVAGAASSSAVLTTPALVVAELMVAATHRRQGIAARMLSAYTPDAPAAWLVTHRDGGAPAFYRRQRWWQDAAFTSGGVPMLLYTWPPETAEELHPAR